MKDKLKNWLKETNQTAKEYYNTIKKVPEQILIELGDLDENETKKELIKTLKEIIKEEDNTK